MSIYSTSCEAVSRINALRRWWPAALALVLAAGAGRDTYLLLRYPVAMGVDGYYYVLQVDSLRNLGHLLLPTRTPLTLYILLGFSYLTGDTVLGVKLGAVTLHALLCLGVFAVVKSLTRSAWSGVLGGALAAASGLHLYLVGEFVNNLGGATLLIWCGWAAVRAARSRDLRWVGASALLLSAAAFSHRTALFLSSSVAALSVLTWLLLNPHRSTRHRRLALIIAAVIWGFPAMAAAQSFFSLPGLGEREVTTIPGWPLDQTTLAEGFILLLAAPAILVSLWQSRVYESDRTIAIALGTVALASLVVTLNPFLSTNSGVLGFGGRLRILAYVQVAILVPGLIWLLSVTRRIFLVYTLALTLPLMLLSVCSPMPFELRHDFLTKRMRLVQNLDGHRIRFALPSVVIAPHGEQFAVTSELGVPSQHLLSRDGDGESIWWLVHKLAPRSTYPSVIVLGEEGEGRYLTIIKDEDLQRLFADMSGDELRRMLEANPHLRQANGSLTHAGGAGD